MQGFAALGQNPVGQAAEVQVPTRLYTLALGGGILPETARMDLDSEGQGAGSSELSPAVPAQGQVVGVGGRRWAWWSLDEEGVVAGDSASAEKCRGLFLVFTT
jgi:hypothetical protein